ncbi:MAG: zf-HC2 domain-containing protein [candidate division NC10 bacterium]|nr:zf-HC2 domain-containing protein [candidate division NC10 bacterium]
MMNCREVTTSASDYIERRLNPLTRLGMLIHLAMCKGCRLYVRQLRLAIRGLRALGTTRQPASVVDPHLLEHFRKANRPQGD